MVVRGGYGSFYEAEGTDGRLNFNFIPFRVSETLTAAANVVPTRTLADFWLGAPVGTLLGAVTWVPLPLEARPGRDQRGTSASSGSCPASRHWKSNYVGTTGDHHLRPAGPPLRAWPVKRLVAERLEFRLQAASRAPA